MNLIDQVIRPEIRAMGAYHVADATGMVKLDVMESPYSLPDWLAREVGDTVSRLALNRYPVPTLTRLRAMLKEKMGVPAGMDLLCGNGSDECIQYITAACAREGATVMAPSPSFVMFQMHALFYRLNFVAVPLRDDFSLDPDAFIEAMTRHSPALVWLAYPNNPTGSPFSMAQVERIVRAAPGLVVIDEAYQPFAADSFMPRLAEFPNMVVMRTVSKISMAGVRMGYVAGSSEWIAEFDKTRAPFNISVLSEAVTIKVLREVAGVVPETPVVTEDDLPVHAMHYTVAEHYDEASDELPVSDERHFDGDLRTLFGEDGGPADAPAAAEFLRSHRRELVTRVSYWTGESGATVRALVDFLAVRAESLGLHAVGREASLLIEITAFATAVMMNFRYTHALDGTPDTVVGEETQ